jgi:putative phosphoesterase
MKIGLISDTHDNMKNIEKSVILFGERRVDFVIHAGDYVTPDTVESFKGVKLIGVLGNNDVDKLGLLDAFKRIGGELVGDLCEIEVDGIKFGVYHGTKPQRKDSLIRSRKYDVLVCGHTHKLEKITVGQTIAVNPGTANGWFFGYNATVAIFNTRSKGVEFISL